MKTYTNGQSTVSTENRLADDQLESLRRAMEFSFGELVELEESEVEQVGTKQYVWTRSLEYKR